MNSREVVLGVLLGAVLVLVPLGVLVEVQAGVLGTSTGRPLFEDSFKDASLIQSMDGVTVANGQVNLTAGGAGVDPIHNPALVLTLAETGNPHLIGAPSVVRVAGTWYMYFHLTPDDYGYAIYLATSTNGLNWTADPTPVVTPSGTAYRAAYPAVLYLNGEFQMWYGSYDGTAYTIYHATSTDGVTWSSGTQVLGTEDVGGLQYWPWDASVLWTGSQYLMWYTASYPGYPGTIRFATSPDGVNWTRQGIVLQATTLDGIALTSVGNPTVVTDGSGFAMWYACGTAVHGYICRARSPDGVAWTQEGIALSPDPSNTLMDLGVGLPAAVLQDDGTYRVYFEARGSQPPPGSSYGDEIWVGTTSLGGPRLGTLTSIGIQAGRNGKYRSFEASWQVPAGTSLTFDILDANDQPIPGFVGMTSNEFSLAGIDGQMYPVIHLRANFVGTPTATPTLYAWEVF